MRAAKFCNRMRGPNRPQEGIKKPQAWSQKWLLVFNEDQCKVMHFGSKNPDHTYSMGGSILTTTLKEKDLGGIITTDLKAAEQVNRAEAAANSMLVRVKKTFTSMDNEMFLPNYKTLVRPRSEHAIQAWSPYLQNDII